MRLKPRITKLSLAFTFLGLTCLSANGENLAPQYQQYNQQLGNNPRQVLNDLLLLPPPPQNNPLNPQHHYTLSLAYLALAYPQKSLDAANKALANLDKNETGWLYHNIIVVKTQAMELSGQAKEALPMIKQSVLWATENNDTELLVDALVGLGYIENTLGQSIKALDAFMQAYELAPENNAIVTKSAIASSIALVYEYRKEDLLAIPYFQESVDYHKASNNLLELSISLYGLGRANKNIGKTELGVNQLQESLDISRAINDDQGVAYALKEMAPIEIENDRIELAETMLNEAAELFAVGENKLMLFDVHKTLTVLNLKNNEPIKAELNLNQAKRFLNEERMPVQAIALAEIEASLLASQNQYQMAFEQLLKTVGKKQALLTQQSTRQLHELRAQFELEEQANAIQTLATENAVQKLNLIKEKQQNQMLVIAVIATAIIVLLLLLLVFKSRKQKQILFKSANFDSLTGLANRSYVWQQLGTIHQQLKEQSSLHIVMLDLDHFKQINDQLGHDVGDQVLQAMGTLLKQHIAPPHLAGRVGGEEFLLAFNDIDYSQVNSTLETIRQQAAFINRNIGDHCPEVRFSAGISVCHSNDSLREQIRVADLAMYRAKATGRNKTTTSESNSV